MNYIWEYLIRAGEEGKKEESLQFLPATCYSPYMEGADGCINETELPEGGQIEVNPNFRFHSVFREMFLPDDTEALELKQVLFNILIHSLGENDLRQGLCKEEYYKQFLQEDIEENAFGEEIHMGFSMFTHKEQGILLEGLVNLYRTGGRLIIFADVIRRLFPGSYLYQNRERRNELSLYLAGTGSRIQKEKIGLVTALFCPLEDQVRLYIDGHFGIIGVEETMRLDEMVLYS